MSDEGERAWAQAVAFTRDRSPASFDQWFSGVQFDGFTDGVLSLRARDEFVRQWVEDYFLPTISEWLRAHTGLSIQVRWTIDVALERPVADRPSSFAPVRPRAISVRPLADAVPRGDPTPQGTRRRAARARVRRAAADRGAQPEVHVRELRRRPVQSARSRGLDGGRGRAAAGATTRSSSAAARASARRTSSTRSPTASARSGPTRASSTSAPSGS